jgi:hypothetical protein
MLASALMKPFVISLQDVSIQSCKSKMKSNSGKFILVNLLFFTSLFIFCIPVPVYFMRVGLCVYSPNSGVQG